MDALNSLELTVKTPNQGVEDIQLKCNEEWTVKRLKEHLQTVYPSKPKSSSQRLIYLGKLLQDHVVLKEIFSGFGAKTLHIVCPDISGVGSSNNSMKTPSFNATSSSNNSTTGTTSITTDNPDGIRYRGPATQTSASTNSNAVPTSFATQYPVHNMFNQHQHQQQQHQQQYHQMWNQQQYQMHMQQYYIQMQQWQQAVASGQWPYQMATNIQGMVNQPQTPPVTPSTPSTPPPAVQQNDEQAAAAARNNVAPIRNNGVPAAQGGAPMNAGPGGAIMEADDEDENGGGNRDWLDILYMSMRAFMLLSIVYFYSSTTRFVMVTILGFIVYLFQAGYLTPRRVAPPPPPTPPPQPRPTTPPAREEPQNEQSDTEASGTENRNEVDGDSRTNESIDSNETSGGESIDTTAQQQQQQQQQPPRPSAFRILCTFFVSFVTSLLPNTPPPLQEN